MNTFFRKIFGALLALLMFSLGTYAQNVSVTATSGTLSGSYPTIREAFEALNNGTHTGDVLIKILNSHTLSSPAVLNTNSTATNVTIRPNDLTDTVVTITAAYINELEHRALIQIKRSNVTLDGRPNGVGSRRLIRLFHASNSGTAMEISSSYGFTENVVIQNLEVFGNQELSTANNTGITIRQGPRKGIVITNSLIKDFAWAINLFSHDPHYSAVNPINELLISENIIEDFHLRGIYSRGSLFFGKINILNNVLRHSESYRPSTFSNPWAGIDIVNQVPNSTWNIVGNHIFDLKTGIVSNRNTRTHNGVIIQNSGAGSTINYFNNYVSLTEANPGLLNQRILFGVRIEQNTNAGTLNIRNNTTIIGGKPNLSSLATFPSAAMVINGNLAGQVIRFKNNVVVNNRVTDSLHGGHAVLWLPSTLNLASVVEFDYNLYWKPTSNNQSNNMVIDTIGRNWYEHRAAFQSVWPTAEANSEFMEINYPISNSPIFGADYNRKFELLRSDNDTSINIDIFGNARAANYYKGAYEGDPFDTNDLKILEVYTLGKLPILNGTANQYSVAIKNVGSGTVSGRSCTLNIAGANNIGPKVVTLPTMAPLQTTIVALDTLEVTDYPNVSGSQIVQVSLQEDDNNTNNSKAILQDLSSNGFSYAYKETATSELGASGGLGVDNCLNCETDFVAKFNCPTAKELNQLKVYFKGINSTATYQIVVYAADGPSGTPGTLIFTSPIKTRPAAPTEEAIAAAIHLIEPAVSINGDYYVGVRQRSDQNIGLAYQTENPLRPNTFYYKDNTASQPSWSDYSEGFYGYRLFFEPVLKASDDLSVTALRSIGQSNCFGPNQTLTAEVKNLGINEIDFSITPATVSLSVDLPDGQGTVRDTIMITSGNIAVNQTITVDFTLDMVIGGIYEFNVKVEYAHDAAPDNNALPTVYHSVHRYHQGVYPLFVSFNQRGTNVPNFNILNEANSSGKKWEFAASKPSNPLLPISGTGVVHFNARNFEVGERARLVLPCMDLTNFNNGVFRINIARDGIDPVADSVNVIYSTDGGITWSAPILSVRRYDPRMWRTHTRWYPFQVTIPQEALTFVRFAIEGVSGGSLNQGLATAIDYIQIFQCHENGTWLGTTEGWFNLDNWCDLQIPTANTNVKIPDSSAKTPVIIGVNATCKNLSLGTNNKIHIGNQSTLRINGNLTGTNSEIINLEEYSGRVIFQGNSTINFTGKSLRINEVELAKNSRIVLDGNTRLFPLNVIYIRDSTSLIISDSASLVLTSDSFRTANLITGSMVSVQGDIEYRRHFTKGIIPEGRSRNISLPINNWTPRTFENEAHTVRVAPEVVNGRLMEPNFYLYDPTRAPDSTMGFYTPVSLTTNLGLGVGASVWLTKPEFWTANQNPSRPAGTYVYKGNQINLQNSFDWTSLLKYCPSGCTYTEPNGFNLIGNPFPSMLDWDVAGWSLNDVDPVIWVFNEDAKNFGVYRRHYYVGTNNTSRFIPSGHGFWVRANSPSASLSATGQVRVPTFRPFLSNWPSNEPQFRIKVKNDSLQSFDEVFVRFRHNGSFDFNRNTDAIKFDGPVMNIALLPVPNARLSIDTRPRLIPNTSQEIILEVSARSNKGTFVLSLLEYSALNDVTLSLKDNYLNTITEITTSSVITFNFTDDPESRRIGRFVLIINAGPRTSLDEQIEVPKAAVNVYPNPVSSGNSFTLDLEHWSSQEASVQIIDMVGRQVYAEDISVLDGKANRPINTTLPAGVYHLVVKAKEGGSVSKRVVIK